MAKPFIFSRTQFLICNWKHQGGWTVVAHGRRTNLSSVWFILCRKVRMNSALVQYVCFLSPLSRRESAYRIKEGVEDAQKGAVWSPVWKPKDHTSSCVWFVLFPPPELQWQMKPPRSFYWLSVLALGRLFGTKISWWRRSEWRGSGWLCTVREFGEFHAPPKL